MKKNWKKRWRLISSVAVGVVAIVLLVAAVTTTNSKVCRGIEVDIYSPSNNFFIDEKQVKELINGAGEIDGQKLDDINLMVLEDRLRKDNWIENAELFFDKNHVLQVKVEEKEPVARIFTTAGSSFYIDSACRRLPLSKTLSARVPMFTSFPSDRTRLSPPDSALMASVKDMALFIRADEFWNAQVAQVDITPAGFEIVPTIGNHLVVFGKGEELQEKFDRLFSFYKQVWIKVGLAAYEKIDVQYKGQVIATKRGTVQAGVDTSRAREALETLLANAKKRNEETVANAKPASASRNEAKTQTTVSASAELNRKKEEEKKEQRENRNESVKKIDEKKLVPKAVMEKKD